MAGAHRKGPVQNDERPDSEEEEDVSGTLLSQRRAAISSIVSRTAPVSAACSAGVGSTHSTVDPKGYAVMPPLTSTMIGSFGRATGRVTSYGNFRVV